MQDALNALRKEIEEINDYDSDKTFEQKLLEVKSKALKAGNPMLADFTTKLIERLER